MNSKSITRCSLCIMPESAEGIKLDESGVCQLCKSFKKIKAKGKKALLKEIEKYFGKQQPEYNCIVPVSGGRDSAYALYYAKKELGLRPIAFHNDNDFETDIAAENLINITGSMDVPLIKLNSGNKRTQKIVSEKCKMNAPFGPGLVVDQTCEACKYGFEAGAYNTAIKNGIKLVIWGDSIEESTAKYHEMVKHVKPTRMERLLSPTIVNLFKYKYYFNQMKKEYGPDSPDGLYEVHLFDFIEWDRKVIVDTIKGEMGWRQPEGSATSWRIDCHLVPLINYLTAKAYGVSKIELGFSQMIRNGKMEREDALKQVAQIDKTVDVNQLKDFLKEEMNISDMCADKLLF